MNQAADFKPNTDALTGIRFFAAIWVVVFHYGRTAVPFDAGWAHNLAGIGLLAVGFFYVLSGFILAYVYEPRYANPGAVTAAGFYRSRLARIYPVYLAAVVLAVMVLARYRPFTPEDVAVYVGKTTAAVMMVQSWLPNFPMSVNAPGWSLSVEVFFYALFPLIFPMIRKRSTAWIMIFLPTVWALGCWLNYAVYYQWFPGSQPVPVRELQHYYPPLHLASFLVGLATGMLVRRGVFRGLKGLPATLLFAASAILVLNLPWLFNTLNQWTAVNWQRTFMWVQLAHNGMVAPLWALVLVCLLYAHPYLGNLFGNRLMRFLGGASYAVYIFQYPVWTLLRLEFFQPRGISDPTRMLAILVVVLTVFSCLVFLLVENPLRRLLTAKVDDKRTANPPEDEQTTCEKSPTSEQIQTSTG